MATIIDFSTRKAVATTPHLCVQCGEPMSTDRTAHPECIKGYEDYWDEREKELESRELVHMQCSWIDDMGKRVEREYENLTLWQVRQMMAPCSLPPNETILADLREGYFVFSDGDFSFFLVLMHNWEVEA